MLIWDSAASLSFSPAGCAFNVRQITFGLAGRNPAKLAAVATAAGCAHVPVFIATSDDKVTYRRRALCAGWSQGLGLCGVEVECAASQRQCAASTARGVTQRHKRASFAGCAGRVCLAIWCSPLTSCERGVCFCLRRTQPTVCCGCCVLCAVCCVLCAVVCAGEH